MTNEQIQEIIEMLGEGIGVYHDTEIDMWEIIQYDTDKHGSLHIDPSEYKKLNQLGLLYCSEQYDIDYDEEDIKTGNTDVFYMDIQYFKWIDPSTLKTKQS